MLSQEKEKPYAKYFYMPYPEVPQDLQAKMTHPMDPALAHSIYEIDQLLDPGYLPGEFGWCMMPDGSGYLSFVTQMPGVTLEMIDWWYSWFGLEDIRYQIFDPNDHFKIKVTAKHLRQRLDPALSLRQRYWNTTDFAVNNVGNGTAALRICYRSPEDFGFDMERLNNLPATAVCAHTGPPESDVPRTVFVHFAREVPGGVELRSRFWQGYMILNKKPVRTDFQVEPDRVKSLSRHAPQEFHRLAKYLPQIYSENHQHIDLFRDFEVMDFSK